MKSILATKSLAGLLMASALAAPTVVNAEPTEAMRQAAVAGVEARAKLSQEMVDSVYSFAEPGFQEVKTSEYLTAVLEKNGFVREGLLRQNILWNGVFHDSVHFGRVRKA